MLFKAIILTKCVLTTHTTFIYKSTDINLRSYDRVQKLNYEQKRYQKLRLIMSSESDLVTKLPFYF